MGIIQEAIAPFFRYSDIVQAQLILIPNRRKNLPVPQRTEPRNGPGHPLLLSVLVWDWG